MSWGKKAYICTVDCEEKLVCISRGDREDESDGLDLLVAVLSDLVVTGGL